MDHPQHRRARSLTLLFLLISSALILHARIPAAKDKTRTNPLDGNPTAIKAGASLFRSGCSPCHGLTARGGGRGPDLASGRWVHGSTDADIFRTITRGVPGTQMPANAYEDSETWTIVAYLRSLAPSAKDKIAGDPAKGEALFSHRYGCSLCHMVAGQGGILGPDLSRVGASRSIAYLTESLRDPDKDLSDGMLDPNNHYGLPLVYDTVTATLKDGTAVTGIAANEDTFSLQLIDATQHIRLFDKHDLASVRHQRKSLMPTYSKAMIDGADLQDLLAYLQSLRGQ